MYKIEITVPQTQNIILKNVIAFRVNKLFLNDYIGQSESEKNYAIPMCVRKSLN